MFKKMFSTWVLCSFAVCFGGTPQAFAASPINALVSHQKTAVISFEVNPSNARIFLPGLQRELNSVDALPKGRYLVEISASGYESERFWVEVDSVDPQKLSVALTPKSEPLSLMVWPPGSSLQWLDSNGNQGEVSADVPVKLALGDYLLTLAKPGYISQQHPITIEENGRYSLQVTLAPTPKLHGEVFEDVLLAGGNGPAMVALRGGSFLMGDRVGEGDWREGPVHEVHIEAFAIGATEVTRGDYQKFLAATGMPTQALSDQEERLPVTHVSYFDATAYAAWLSAQTGEDYTLPTEAEWEYAARANSPDNYSFGHEINCELARYDGLNRCGLAEAAPVGSYPANAFGLYDMHGNVWEWTKNCAVEDYSSFAGAEHTEGSKHAEVAEVTDQTCHRAMLRGGSFNLNAHKLRVSYRSWRYKDYRHNDTGFRLVRRVAMNEE
ncbi:MAG: hypothetical protein RL336_815 [Pseudomonadota bacterium]